MIANSVMRRLARGARYAWSLPLVLAAGAANAQPVTFQHTGAAQSYTSPVGADRVDIQAAGAGGGGGGADLNGIGGAGGAGAVVRATYPVSAGVTVTFNVMVGGGGKLAYTSTNGRNCTNSAGAGGSAGGTGGVAGSQGGQSGCGGYSGGGGGGGAASVVATTLNAPLVVAGGGGGGQGAAWNTNAGSGANAFGVGALPTSSGTFESDPADGGGGGGGGGGCAGGIGGAHLYDNTTVPTRRAEGGKSCSAAPVSGLAVLAALGGSGGIGAASLTVFGTNGGDGSVTLTPVYPVTGTVYGDVNHNAQLDAGEAGTGLATWYVKLSALAGGVCAGPATAAAVVSAATGFYSLPSVQAGQYCLILDSNNTLSDIAPAVPTGWLGTQNPTGVIWLTVLSGQPQAPKNFGLFNGSRLSGTVFADTGAGGASANNGLKDGAEPGIASVTVNARTGATAVAGASTAGDGSYTLWLPASASGPVTVTPAAPVAYLATGGVAGTTGGSYSRPTVSYTPATGQSYSGVNFGLVPPNTLAPNGAQTAQPGTVVFYAHSFLAGSGGQVTFSLVSTATPASPSWSQVLYRDSNCNGTLDTAEPQVTAAITATAGQTLCLVVKQFVPADAGLGAQNTVTLSAAFGYTGASPSLSSTLTANDITTVGEPGALTLSKLVSNLTQRLGPATAVNAAPGNTLQYTLTAVNNGSEPLSTLVINDATPAFTTYLFAACPASLPAGLSACNVSTQPAAGAQGSLQWTFSGSLAPSAQLAVTYQVNVNQ